MIPDLKKSESLPSSQRDFKSSSLPSTVRGKHSPSKPSEEPNGQPPAKKKKIDLIFKDVLEASLEGSAWDKSQSSLPSECKTGEHSSWIDSIEGGFSVPCLKVEKEEENQRGEEPSTSFCHNCIKLKRRILELEEELYRLKGDQRDGPSRSERGPPKNQLVPPHPEQSPAEDVQGMILEKPELFLSQGQNL